MLERRLIIVSGKGGVGKSAVSVALAIQAARSGKRVLAIGMVDGTGLATHLGVEELSYEPHEVRPGLFGLAVSRPDALAEYLRLQVHIPRGAPTGALTRGLNVLVETAPGIREVVSMGKPLWEVWNGSWDLVVVDAPPLGQLFSYLRAPATVADLVPAGRIRQQAARMSATLIDPKLAGLLLVITAEELPVGETIEALHQLHDEPLMDLAGLVFNRVLDPLESAPPDLASLPPSPLRDAAILHSGIATSQRFWLDQIPAGIALPFLFGVHTPAEVAARLADALEATGAAEL